MKKKTYNTVLIILLALNLFWAFGWAILNDFYPQYEGMREVFGIKAGVNGAFSALGLAFWPMAMGELRE